MPEALTAANANPNFKVVSFEDGEGFITEPEDTAIAIGVAKIVRSQAK